MRRAAAMRARSVMHELRRLRVHVPALQAVHIGCGPYESLCLNVRHDADAVFFAFTLHTGVKCVALLPLNSLQAKNSESLK